MTYNVGGFSLTGFAGGTFSALNLPTDSDGGFSANNYVFNWTGVDRDGGNPGGEVVTVSGDGTTWSLTVKLVTQPFHSNGMEFLRSGTQVLAGGDLDGAGYTAHGTGAAALQSFIQSLQVDTPNGGWDYYNISFSLIDVAAGATASWDQHFGGADVPCYMAGTRIAVPGGERMVEELRIGDLVLTATGAAKAVKWIGRRSYTAAQVAANPHLRSVLVRKDAMAPGMPHRDLNLSPMHSLYVDDVFVPVVALVNGVSILRNVELVPLSYVHIEMDGHDVVFAEGQPAETYVDDASRQMFDNADEYYATYGADRGTVTFSAPRIEEGVQLEALRRRIAARAGLPVPTAGAGKLRGHVERLEDGVMHGWVFDTTAPSTPVEIEIVADGEVVATAIANRYRVDLDHAGLAGGHAGFTVVLPASIVSLREVTVRRTTDGAKVAVPAAAMAD